MALNYIRDVSGQDPWLGEGQVAKLYHEPTEDWHVVVTAIPADPEHSAQAGTFKVDENGEATFETFILPPVLLPDDKLTGSVEDDITAAVAHFEAELVLMQENPPTDQDFLAELLGIFGDDV